MIGMIGTILLTILKIIGIVLLVLVAIIILGILIILFVPLCYEVKAYFDEEIRVYVKYSWLFYIINGKFIKEGEEQELTLRFLIFNILKNEPKEEVPKEEVPKEEVPKEEVPKEEVPKEEVPKEEVPKEEVPKEEVPKEEVPKEEVPKEKKPKRIKKKKVKAQKQKSIKEKIIEFWEFLQQPENEGVLKFIIKRIKKIIISILPKKLKIDIEIGLDDPANTGMLTGIASMLYAYTNNIHIMPNFEKQIIKGEAIAKGRLYIYPIVFETIRIILNKKVRRLIKKVRSL